MTLTAYPNGVSSFGMPLIGSGPVLTTGNVFFVSSTASNASNGNVGTSPDKPFATIDYAIGKCTAGNGDYIIAMPGHVETVAAAAGLAFDVAGVSLAGIGRGSARPKVNFTATASTMTVSAANVYIENIQFVPTIDAVVSPIIVSGADFTMFNFLLKDTSATQVTDFIVTTAGASRMELAYFEYDGDTAAGTNAGIAIVGGDNIKIHDFIADGNFAVGFIDVRTTATTDLKVFNVPSFRTRNAADIFLVDTITASTGTIGPDLNLRLQDNAANITEALTGATFVYFQPINIVNLAGESSMQTNITASTDA